MIRSLKCLQVALVAFALMAGAACETGGRRQYEEVNASEAGGRVGSADAQIDGVPLAMWIEKARAAEEGGQYARAMAIYLKVGDASPTGSLLQATMLCGEARIYVTVEDYDTAEEKCARLLKSEFRSIRAKAHFHMASLHRSRGEYKSMRDSLRTAVVLGEDSQEMKQFTSNTRHLGPGIGVDIQQFVRWGERATCGGLLMNTVTGFSDGKYLYRNEGLVFLEGGRRAFTGTANCLLYGTDELACKVAFSKGRQHGLCTWYGKSGKRWSKGSYANGRRDGLFTMWWPNGRKNNEVRYIRGDKQGVETRWRRDGTLFARALYKDGRVVSTEQFEEGPSSRQADDRGAPEQVAPEDADKPRH